MVRRPPGMGSIYRRKRDMRWCAQVSQGPRGSRTTVTRVRRTRAAALDALEQLRAESGVASPTMTTGQYLASWLVTAERSVRASTLETYEITVRRQLIPAFGGVRISRLDLDHVEAMVRDLALDHTTKAPDGTVKTHPGMTPKGIRNVLGVLSAALMQAERQGLVRRNVARLVQPPRLDDRDPDAITADEVRGIRAAVAGDRLEALYVLALATGMRQAEVLGLVWDDWDREASTVRVRFTLDRIAGEYVRTEPKTKRSRRTIALPAFANDALAAHLRRQLAERIAAGRETDAGLIFVTPEGRPINGGWLSHHWPKIAKAAGVTITFHGMRHAQADLLIAAGVSPKATADRLGHATTKMTMDVYAGRSDDADREAAQRLQEAIGG